jgi:TonB family protein
MTPMTIGRFRVHRQLGAGGMGVVFEGEDPALRRRVALKLMPPLARLEGERRVRFLREARAAAAVTHAHVVTIYEVGEDESEGPYLAMELVSGGSLRERLGRGPLPLRDALRIAREMCAGVAAAHEAGLVHRDLKPENVLLTSDGSAKVADFGLAKALAPEGAGATPDGATDVAGLVLTAEGSMMGSPGYMAPEQARGAAIDARSDVFALGVILFELVAGRRPFGGATPMAEIVAAAADDAPDLREHAPGAPETLALLVSRCLSREPEQRPASARDVLESLRALEIPNENPSLPRADAYAATVASAPTIAPPARATPSRRLLFGLAAILLGVGLATLLWLRTPAPEAASEPDAVSRGPMDARPEGSAGDAASSTADETTPDAPEYLAPRGQAARDPRGPLTVLCGGRGEPCLREDLLAFCDRAGRRVACCAPGLVPAGDDGLCGCPPGGTLDASAASSGCARAEREGLSPEAIRRTARAVLEPTRGCFESVLEDHPEAAGRVLMRFVITAYGDVYDVSIEGASMPFPEVQRCILAALRDARFDAPGGGDVVVVTYPFSFGPDV